MYRTSNLYCTTLYGASELRMGGALANPDDMIWYDRANYQSLEIKR